MKIDLLDLKCAVQYSSTFKKSLKRVIKQGKYIQKLNDVLFILGNNGELDSKYKNHQLIDDKYYKNCFECHIEPDWLLIYRYENNSLILVMVDTGSHSELFN